MFLEYGKGHMSQHKWGLQVLQFMDFVKQENAEHKVVDKMTGNKVNYKIHRTDMDDSQTSHELDSIFIKLVKV